MTITNLPLIAKHSQFNPSIKSPMNTGYKKVKFMCSSSGKILPRPSDMKLRYVGGETRMVSLPRHINYEAFYRKMVEHYGPDIILKYQLPEEDLDALVSVSSDEDLENMMEECDRMSTGEGLSKLRAFIFLASELDVQILDEIANFKSSERKFVDALNAIAVDTLPAVHYTRKLYPTSDSFNDAYKAWNGIHSQDKDSFLPTNPYSEALPLEDYVSSGNLCTYESFVPNHGQNLTSQFPHSVFMGQPVLSCTVGVSEVFENDLVSWRDPSSLFGQGIGQGYGGSHWVTSSEMSVPTQFTNDDRRDDRKQEVDLTFGESKKEDCCSSQMSQDCLTYDRKTEKIFRLDQASAPDSALLNANAESPTKRLESGDTSKHSIGQPQSGPLDLSPGALLQKQLMSSPSNVAPLQKHLYTDWPSGDLSPFIDRQPYSLTSDLENQLEAFSDPVMQKQLEKLPADELSFGLDLQNHVFENIDNQSFGVQHSMAAEVLPLSTEYSSAIFAANTAPFSSSGWKLQVQKDYKNVLLGNDNSHTPMAGGPPQDSRAPWVSDVVFLEKPSGKIVQIDATVMSGQSLSQDVGDSNQMPVTEECYTVLTSRMIDQEVATTEVDQLKSLLRLSKGSVPLSILSDDRINQPIGTQNDEQVDCFLGSVKNGQFSGLSVPTETLLSSHLNTTSVKQHKIVKVGSFSNLKEVSLPATSDGSHRLDKLSELFGLNRLAECLAAKSSTSESFRSRSETSVDEELHCEESEKVSVVVVREKQLFTANESSDFPLPTQEELSSFQTTQTSLASNEQFDKVLVPALPTNINDIFADAGSLRNTEDVSNACPSQVLALTSLIKSWEATLLQDEQKMKHMMQEHVQKEIDVSPTLDRETEVEHPGVESEEVEVLRLFDLPMNAAAIAEQEAISRGLQIIRNSDLEELCELGSGTFGTVCHGKWRGTDVAIKRIKASCFSGRQAERDRLVADFWREACILGQLHHPNVVAFYGVVTDGPGATLATVTEYMVNGSLKQVLQNKDRTLDRRKRLLIAMDAAFGMEYLHGKNVVHFDIKCENLLVNLRDAQRPICKVGDLGLSKVKQRTFVSGGVRGTLPWMAPELLNGSSTLVSEKVDVFSFGIVMWELLTGEEPYANMHYGAIIGGIVNNTLRPTIPRWCDPAWRSLMEKCWAAVPNDRPTFQEIARALRAMEVSLAAKGPGQARILELYR